MVFGIAIGWLVASIGLYSYLVATAEECDSECFDCRELSCRACPMVVEKRLAA